MSEDLRTYCVGIKNCVDKISSLNEITSIGFKSTYAIMEKSVNYILSPMVNCLVKYSQDFEKFQSSILGKYEIASNITEQCNKIYENINSNIANMVSGSLSKYQTTFQSFRDKVLFMEIANEIGFPVYLEVETELQDLLLESYRDNGNRCNKEEMQKNVLDYYNDEYIDKIMLGISNTFCEDRVKFISQGVQAYKFGWYGVAGATFAVHLSGMIHDINEELKTLHSFSKREIYEIKECFSLQRCRDDSEKVMLSEVLWIQNSGRILWTQVADYFINVTYSSKDEQMETQPMRNKICHGVQLNYDTKEMCLKLILCMDIMAELSYRVKRMKEEVVIVES